MSIGSLNLTPQEKFIEKLEAGLEKKQEVTAPVSPTLPPEPTYNPNRQSTQRTKVQTDEWTGEQTTIRTNGQKVKRPLVRMSNRTNGRKKIRHPFDIFEDQLIALKETQLNRQKATGDKYSLGDLAKEALDLFLANERTNGQVNK